MIEISENGFDYVINRIKEFADENSGLKIQNKQLVRELRASNGEKEVFQQKNFELSSMLEHERKDAKRMLETIENLKQENDKLTELWNARDKDRVDTKNSDGEK